MTKLLDWPRHVFREDHISVNEGGNSGANFVWRDNDFIDVGIHVPTPYYPHKWQHVYLFPKDGIWEVKDIKFYGCQEDRTPPVCRHDAPLALTLSGLVICSQCRQAAKVVFE